MDGVVDGGGGVSSACIGAAVEALALAAFRRPCRRVQTRWLLPHPLRLRVSVSSTSLRSDCIGGGIAHSDALSPLRRYCTMFTE